MPARLQITDTGVTASNSFGQGTYPWSHFHKWKEGKSLLLVYYSDVLFIIVPKRCFDRQEDLDRFRNLLLTNVRREP